MCVVNAYRRERERKENGENADTTMLYTPQQLAGGSKFRGGVRIGNWYEDACYDRGKMEAFRGRREEGEISSEEDPASVAVPHSFSADGSICYGDTIMIRGKASKRGVLTCESARDETRVFGSRGEGGAMARNTFVLTRDESATTIGLASSDATNKVTYGDVLYLCSNPSLTVDPETGALRLPMYLSSERRTVAKGLPEGGQICIMTTKRSRDARWKVVPKNVRREAVMEGQLVPANEGVLLRHVSTNAFLATLPDGSVVVHTYKKKNTLKCTDCDVRNEVELVTSSSPALAVDNREFRRMTPDLLIEKIRGVMKRRAGSYGLRALARGFRTMDIGRDGLLSREDLAVGLLKRGLNFSNQECDVVLDAFDTNGDGFISIAEFTRALRGPMNNRRVDLVLMAYDNVLDTDRSGVVSFDEICDAYDAKNHPDVVKGVVSETDALRAFASHWDKDGDGTVTRQEFLDYYADISACIDSDDVFELTIRNCWHLSGGEGACENTTCRRVLVVRRDGRESVEEVKNDMGMSDSLDEIRAKLEAQGMGDIAKIKLAS